MLTALDGALCSFGKSAPVRRPGHRMPTIRNWPRAAGRGTPRNRLYSTLTGYPGHQVENVPGSVWCDNNLILHEITPVLSQVAGTAAVVGGSQARGTATDTSDRDIGLPFRRDNPLDTQALRRSIE